MKNSLLYLKGNLCLILGGKRALSYRSNPRSNVRNHAIAKGPPIVKVCGMPMPVWVTDSKIELTVIKGTLRTAIAKATHQNRTSRTHPPFRCIHKLLLCPDVVRRSAATSTDIVAPVSADPAPGSGGVLTTRAR